MKKLFLLIAVLLITMVAAFICDATLKVLNWRKERALLVPILNDEPAFSHVRIELASIGYCYLAGEVDTKDDLNKLFSHVAAEFGESQAEMRIRRVRINDDLAHPNPDLP